MGHFAAKRVLKKMAVLIVWDAYFSQVPTVCSCTERLTLEPLASHFNVFKEIGLFKKLRFCDQKESQRLNIYAYIYLAVNDSFCFHVSGFPSGILFYVIRVLPRQTEGRERPQSIQNEVQGPQEATF